ncbi:NAD-dependent epimerase/dehydratase family protein [Catenuloplanes atrovinosus]|uniref:Dihydroflavonol-4-reductase n=1 Tax=Catenuloplanes atrovinosus TaxID=137266 RepID=A0AAE3YLS6_9ACTN|nr:NAD-dependent epimerase/dehydratase family protein [Catenuloplanes atrovinosus]MDR7274862.1 dihydroflavonol-4-reductase [Catenuloplanes atrovinosus]
MTDHSPTGPLVLVTGGSGFLGAHCVDLLLRRGHRVRTTVRSPARRAAVPDRVDAVVADLTSDDGWAQAAAGCAAVLHVASPFPPREPRHPDEVIVPAREGTLRVLRAALDAGVRRTVVTSSFGAIGYGPDPGRPFTEADWSEDPSGAYIRSKVVAERAAWDFADRHGLPLTVVNPTGILGPPLTPDYSQYVVLIEELLNGKLPALPRLTYGLVDVRDVADLHLRAMTHPDAVGERFIATAGLMSFQDIAALLRARLGPAARRVPARTVPDLAVRLAARVSPRLAMIAPDVGVVRPATADKARAVLGWAARPLEETVLDTAASLSRLGRLRSPIA